MTIKTKELLLHLTGCLFFLSLPVLLSPDFDFTLALVHNRHFLRDFMTYALIIPFFYLHYFFLIPALFFQKKHLFYVCIMLLCFILITFLPRICFPWHNDFHFRPPLPFRNHNPLLMDIGHTLFIFLMVVFFSFTWSTTNRLKQTQKEKLQAELSYLKAQINPHFLFNSLNSIYALAIERSDKTADAVVRLAGMMRYVISEASRDYVSLEKELAYIQDFIELQKIRLGKTIKLDYQVTGEPGYFKIAPLILIPFVENAFKYGVNAEENSDIRITITIFENNLKLETENNKVKTNIGHIEKNLVGIENTKSRLLLLYPGRHQLNIHDSETTFKVSLLIELS